MSEKHKIFFDLSSRQKRRRLSNLPARNVSHVHLESNLESQSSSDVSESLNPDVEYSNDEVQNLFEMHVELERAENIILDPNDSDDSDDSENIEDPEDPEDLEDPEPPEPPEPPEDLENREEAEDPAVLKKRILKNAFLAAGLKHSQGNIILKTLTAFPFNLIYLPKDARTLLNTPTDVSSRHVEQIAGGEYLHIGLKATLIKRLEKLPADKLPETIDIDFSTDGAKVDKGMNQYWPIQYRILNINDKRPIIAGLYKGIHKPSNPFDFFEKFTTEVQNIREEGGIYVRDKILLLNIRSFIADGPARAFSLHHFGHNSGHACSKCKVYGHRYNGRMVFLGIQHEERTDADYELANDEDHHKGRSPLADVLGLVTQVPFESMHSVYLGVTRKIFVAKIDGNFGHQKLNGRKINIIDSRMEQLSLYCPSEFNRRPREISKYVHFKATEFRQILLYTAPTVLKTVFSPNYYQHFMMLHSAMRILVSEETPRRMYAFCQQLIESFVTLCIPLYGESFLSYNVHSLLHLVADVEVLGPIESFSAFPYENNIPTLRKLIRKPHLSLQQVYRRLSESSNIDSQLDNTINIRASLPHQDGPLLENFPAGHVHQFHKLEIGAFTLSTALRDNCCILEDSSICIIENIVQQQEDFFLIVRKFRTMISVYDVGISSDFVGAYYCSKLSNEHEAVNFRSVKSKVYRMPKFSINEGEEEHVVEDEWTCVTLITPIVFPEN